MTLHIPDDILKDTHLSERDLAVELAFHLFNIEKLTVSQARRMAGMTRGEFEDECFDRHIPVYRYTLEMWQEDLQTLEKMRQGQ